ncbi:olfactomedin-like protein 2B [Ornithorhynchus anatinus]|uniref:olfactomedin-like protein 2B n=1 Tax=Ornithorhynchus anatinus TaxID=9258 RepID=UPI0010A787C8|nr:olfactomedin-like protein 2B [Ornithorhynchus anatinus]
MARPLVLGGCCYVLVVSWCWGSAPPPPRPPDGPPEEESPLQNEADNQENVLSQLLGDYDKVKAVSEGTDCRCKCVVRPLDRGACQRMGRGAPRTEDTYTVETITSGPDCKCACVAPPSALNPCEGDYRLKKLREADGRDLKLSTVIDLLEGAFYGLDLLKLHSVTSKLVGRVERLEEEVSKNLTKENERLSENTGQVPDATPTGPNRTGANCSADVTGDVPDIRAALQRDAAAAYAPLEEQYEERFLRDETVSQQVNAIDPPRPRPPSPSESGPPRRALTRQIHLRSRPASQPTVIRGVTYYKAKVPEEDNDIEERADELFSGDNTIDLLIEEQLLRHRPSARPTGSAVAGATTDRTPETPGDGGAQAGSASTAPASPQPSVGARPDSTASPERLAGPPGTPGPEADGPATAAARTAARETPGTEAPGFLTASPPPSTTGAGNPASVANDSTATGPESPPAEASPSGAPAPNEDEEDEEEDIRHVIGRCKDTLSTITGPTTQNTYGHNEGAWMKDALAQDERIYITNNYVGNTLVEFRNLESFKQGRWSNSYKLPYNWVGTGHVVYSGAFYYNRASTRNIIKYDLKQRYVAAWAMLHDMAYEEATPRRGQGHSDVDFAVDENGLWLVYPALDDEGFGQEVVVLTKLHAGDLSTHKETTWRTGLRRNLYGHCFVICGVLYAVDSYDQRQANISYAFDTHTNTQMAPRLLFENRYSFTTQIDYNPKDRLLYAWDNGHQVNYHVIFAY